ncbi:hypothetical protein QBC36DRAFT_294868 [Triangularia setosa]|uniref:Uncharacterized protein n=1 Tax=Triangularia setosa TaxID=2587417 RepID=A0AAN7A2Q6_9PEZI|nr:hypothetical protein QBC36DRAFT_294868 [Podospora setosa]
MAAYRSTNLEPADLNIPATRIKGKPGAGLRKIPQSAQEWLESAVVHGLAVRTLGDLCRRGMDKLETLLDLIYLPSPTDAPRTPEKIAYSLGDALSIFACLVSLYNRLMKQLAATPTLEETRPLVDAPVARKFQDAGLTGSIPRRSALGRGVRNLGGAIANLRLQNQPQEDVERPDRASGYPNPRTSQNLREKNESTTSSESDGSNNGGTQTIISNEGLGATSRDATGPCLPSPRAPPEIVAVDFLVNFMAAIAIQIQPFGRKPVCVADAFEQNFRFGPVPGPVRIHTAVYRQKEGMRLPGVAPSDEVDAGGQQPLQLAASFLARIDGGIPCYRPRADGELFVAFEHQAQQPHETGLTNPLRHHHTLIISQDEFRLVSQLVLALLIWQMKGFEASRLIASAIGRYSDNEDDEDDEDDLASCTTTAYFRVARGI